MFGTDAIIGPHPDFPGRRLLAAVCALAVAEESTIGFNVLTERPPGAGTERAQFELVLDFIDVAIGFASVPAPTTRILLLAGTGLTHRTIPQ